MTDHQYSIWRPSETENYGELYYYDEFIASGHINDLFEVKKNHQQYFCTPLWRDTLKRKYYKISPLDDNTHELTFGTNNLREVLATGNVLDLIVRQNQHQFTRAQQKQGAMWRWLLFFCFAEILALIFIIYAAWSTYNG